MAKAFIRPGTVYEIIKQSTNARISEDAVKYLADYLTEMCIEIGQKAAELASHSKRKTIKKEDIVFVIKNV